MDSRERNRYEMLVRIDQFGKDNAADFPAGSAGKNNFATIAEVIENLRQSAAAQTSGAASSVTTRKVALRDALRQKMKAISRTARALAIDNPNLNRLFRLPESDNDVNLIAAARQFVADAAQFKTDFTGYGLTNGFIEDLNQDIAQFENLLGERAQAVGEQISATAAIDDELARGMNAAQRLNAIVQNVYHNDSAKLAAWTSARHIERRTRPIAQPTEKLPG